MYIRREIIKCALPESLGCFEDMIYVKRFLEARIRTYAKERCHFIKAFLVVFFLTCELGHNDH